MALPDPNSDISAHDARIVFCVDNPDDAAVKKLKDLTSQLDKATTAGKEAAKQVASAKKKAAKVVKLVESAAARRKRLRLRSKKR